MSQFWAGYVLRLSKVIPVLFSRSFEVISRSPKSVGKVIQCKFKVTLENVPTMSLQGHTKIQGHICNLQCALIEEYGKITWPTIPLRSMGKGKCTVQGHLMVISENCSEAHFKVTFKMDVKFI